MRSARVRWVSALSVVLLSAGFVVGVAAPANAALPPGPTTVGVTGSRPGATEIPFAVSDQVEASVDVATGNLRVSNASLSLVGVNGAVAIGQSYNSLSTTAGAATIPAANRWTVGIQGVGYLSSVTGGVVYTAGDGTTWKYTTGTGGAFASPAGAKADLVAVGATYKLTDRQSRQVATFNSDGQPTTIADRNGNATTIGYSTAGNPNSVTSSAGPTAARTATLTYSSTTRTLTATQTNGSSTRAVNWVKDPYSNLTSIVDAEGKTTSFGYTGQQLTTITGPTGAVVTIAYESASSNRVVSVSQANTTAGSPGTSVTRFAYPSSTSRLLARPNTNQSSAVAAVPHITYTINASTNLVTAATDELGRQRAATYTPNGDVATATSGTGSTAGTTTATYGANGGDSMTSLKAPGGATRKAAFANTAPATAYLASSSTDDAGNTSTYTYNGTGNALTSSNALAATATLTYNADGTVATALAPGNGANKTLYGYNANKQLTSMTPVTGASLGARAFTYDDFGRLKTATDGRGTTTTYTYDKQDRLLTTSFSGSSAAAVTNTYTNRGLPATRVDGNGTTTYTYDQLGRLIARVNSFFGGTISYGHDKSSNLVTVTDGRGTTTNSFDTAGVPTKITYTKPSGTSVLEFAVDDQGRRTDSWLQSNPTHTVWRAHTHVDYDTTGRVSRSIAETRQDTTPATVTTLFDTSYCYNTGSAAPTCGATAANDRSKLQWSRDNLTGQVTAYGYDTAGRLLTATQSGGTSPSTYTYTYDARGNRLTATVTGGGASSQTLTFNPANQVTNTGFTYDGTGNLTADGSGTYTYNGAQQMTTVANSGGSFAYKYAGTSQAEVLQQESSSRDYKLVYGRTNQVGLPVVEQVQAGGSLAYIENDPVTGEPLMLRSSSGIETLYVYDGLGSPVAMLTDYATQAYAYRFDPFGTAALTAGGTGNGVIENPFLFKGGIQDRATGWVHYGNRWYNTTLGRWTQQDTLDAPLDPKNANRYAYAGADPINNIDPTGKISGACVASAVTAAGAGVALAAEIGLAVAAAIAPEPVITKGIAWLTAGLIAGTYFGFLGATASAILECGG